VDELKKWNLTLSNNLVDVPARILSFEQIKSKSRAYDGGFEADWTRHLRNLPMFTCASMSNWVILAPQDCCNDVNSFALTLKKTAIGMSFTLPQPTL